MLDALVAVEVGNAELLLRRAELHRLDGNVTNALADLAAAEKFSPDLAGVWWVRGRLLMERHEPARALPDLNRWLRRHPRHAEALAWRARAREQEQDFTGAVADYGLAISVAKPASPELFLARSQVQRQLGPEHLPAALKGLDEGIGQLGDLVTLQLEAIAIEQALGRLDAALARLDTLTLRATRKESWHARRAELLEHAGRPAEARLAWQQSLEACLSLPARLRQTRATQELEQRVRDRLTTALIAETERQMKPAPMPMPATTALLRTIPAHESPTR